MKQSTIQHIKHLGFTELTRVQKESLANYQQHSEIILYSKTGSGKTLAFLLPLIELLSDTSTSGTKAVIIAPTRELALQLETVFKSLKTDLLATTCCGGHSIKTEINNLMAQPDIVIGTPGRLDDLLNRRALDLSNVDYFLVDEFDKCLELGFQKEIEHIFRSTRQIQKSFYCSATRLESFPSFIQLQNKVVIDVLDEQKAPEISYYSIKQLGNKLRTIAELIPNFQLEPTIVFCNFREDVEGIADYLSEEGIELVAYHGGLEQDERERALIKYRNGSAPVLVCTDLGSRGLDIPEIKHIVHFQLPEKEAAFIHRNGRTARMHEKGAAYYFEEDAREVDFDLPKSTSFTFKKNIDYVQPEWETVYFSAGKKNKINKIDLVGFICQKGGLAKSDIGIITVLDFASYVSIQRDRLDKLLPELRKHKIKGQKLRIAISK